MDLKESIEFYLEKCSPVLHSTASIMLASKHKRQYNGGNSDFVLDSDTIKLVSFAVVRDVEDPLLLCTETVLQRYTEMISITESVPKLDYVVAPFGYKIVLDPNFNWSCDEVLNVYWKKRTEYIQVCITGSRRVRDLADNVYTLYSIQVLHGELKWMITRRYRDFAQLIQQLPPLPVSLPPKQWWNVLEPEFVAQRQTKLDTFLQNITNHPVVRESVAVLSFLGAISTTLYDHEEITGNKRDVVHLRVLNRYVNPGDILLFRCRTRTSQLQRSLTRSEWDHVAMIVKQSYGFGLLEATSDGVHVCPLINRIRDYASCYTNYIAVRKLTIDKSHTATSFEKLVSFTNKTRGKPYGMDLLKLFAYSTSSPPSTYFCSELIAQTLMAMDLLPSSTAACSYWPGCFVQGNAIDKALQHASYSQETLIDTRMLEIARAKPQESELHLSVT